MRLNDPVPRGHGSRTGKGGLRRRCTGCLEVWETETRAGGPSAEAGSGVSGRTWGSMSSGDSWPRVLRLCPRPACLSAAGTRWAVAGPVPPVSSLPCSVLSLHVLILSAAASGPLLPAGSASNFRRRIFPFSLATSPFHTPSPLLRRGRSLYSLETLPTARRVSAASCVLRLIGSWTSYCLTVEEPWPEAM